MAREVIVAMTVVEFVAVVAVVEVVFVVVVFANQVALVVRTKLFPCQNTIVFLVEYVECQNLHRHFLTIPSFQLIVAIFFA